MFASALQAGIRAAHEESLHAAYALEGGGYEARNAGQQWRTSFDGRGFSVLPDAGGWTCGLGLESYGFAGSEQEVTTPARTTAEGGRVTYDWNATRPRSSRRTDWLARGAQATAACSSGTSTS